jgi:hypothetical protein
MRILLLLLFARPLFAACDNTPNPGLVDGPVNIGLYESDMATGRRACPRSELTLGARAAAIVATGRFYGNIGVDTLLTGSYSIRNRGEIFGSLEVVHWQFVQNATIKGTEIGLGQLTLGGSLVAIETERWVLTPFVRMMLPTSTLGERVLGGELGVASEFRPHRRLALHGFVSFDVSGGASSAPAFIRRGASFALGMQYMPWSWLALTLDLDVQVGHLDDLDVVALAPSLRFRFRRGFGLELAALAPVAGEDGHDFALLLRLANRF